MELLVQRGTRAHPPHGIHHARAPRNGAATRTTGASCHGATSAVLAHQSLPAPSLKGPLCITATTPAAAHPTATSTRRIGVHGRTCRLLALSIALPTCGTPPSVAPTGSTRHQTTTDAPATTDATPTAKTLQATRTTTLTRSTTTL